MSNSASGRLLIRGAKVVSSRETRDADVLVEDGRIAAVEPSLKTGADETIDATGLHLLPGALDPQVHFREPGLEWKEDLASGSRAAAAGGVTSFFDMPNTSPATTDRAAMAQKKALAARRSLVNYNFFIGATADNLDELNAVENVPGIKIFMAASTGSLLLADHAAVERIFRNGRRLIAVHSEDEATIRANAARFAGSCDVTDHMRIRSPEAALTCTRFIVGLARACRRRLHILHLTTREEVDFLQGAGEKGLISCEVCPQHLFLHAPEDYARLGTYVQMNPPVRDRAHADALWRGLTEGVIDCMATDHAPHTRAEKEQPFRKAPSGMPGVETLLPLMLHQVNLGRCALGDVVRWLCEKPVELYRVRRKGRIEAGYDADLVLVDLRAEWTIRDGQVHAKCGWSPYHGWTIRGRPLITIVNGRVVYREGEFAADPAGREIEIGD